MNWVSWILFAIMVSALSGCPAPAVAPRAHSPALPNSTLSHIGQEESSAHALARAEEALAQGQFHDALSLTSGDPPQQAITQRWWLVRARAHLALGELEAAHHAYSGASVAPISPASFAAWVIESLGEAAAYSAAMSLRGEGDWQVELQTLAAEHAASESRWTQVAALVDASLPGVTHTGLRERLEALRHRASVELSVRPEVLGVLLPLSGPHARAGEQALRALRLALEADASVLGSAIRLEVRDTKGEPEQAAAMALRLTESEPVAAILGPVGAKESTAVAHALANLAVPVFSLAPLRAKSDRPTWFFTRLAPSRECDALVAHAALELNVRRIFAVVPDNAAGREYLAALEASIDAIQGGAAPGPKLVWTRKVPVGGLASGPASSLDWGKVAKELQGALGQGPDSAAAALYLPLAPPAALALLRELDASGVALRRHPDHEQALQVMGSRALHTQLAIDAEHGSTEGAIIAGAFWAGASAHAAAFSSKFSAEYGAAVTDFDAEVYDAARLVMSAMQGQSEERRGWTQVVATAMQSSPYRGLSGSIPLHPPALAGRMALLMTIQGSQIRPRVSVEEERILRTGH